MTLSKMTKRESEILVNLKTFRDISSNQKAHTTLLKEKKIILYAATLLESDNIKILELCLQILENFTANEECHEFLVSTFGIYEALEALSIRIRDKNGDIYNRVLEITDILRNSTPPAYNTRKRVRTTKPLRRHQLFLLYIEEMNEDNQVKIERSVVRIKGVISVLIDLEMKRCTIRICPKLTIKEVVQKIYDKCELKVVLVTKNRDGIETYCDILEKDVNKSYLEYTEEINSPRAKALTTAYSNLGDGNGSIFKSIVDFWNDSFYCYASLHSRSFQVVHYIENHFIHHIRRNQPQVTRIESAYNYLF